jgi:hypothetical protein
MPHIGQRVTTAGSNRRESYCHEATTGYFESFYRAYHRAHECEYILSLN